MGLNSNRRYLIAWAFAAAMASAVLLWTAFNVMGSPGGIGFSILLLLTLLAVFFAAWRGRTAQRRTLESTENMLREMLGLNPRNHYGGPFAPSP